VGKNIFEKIGQNYKICNKSIINNNSKSQKISENDLNND